MYIKLDLRHKEMRTNIYFKNENRLELITIIILSREILYKYIHYLTL